MRRFVLRMMALVALTFSIAGATPVAVYATSTTNVLNGIDCSKAPDSSVCKDTGSGNGVAHNPLTGNDGVIIKIANIVAVVAGVAAVIMIVVSGLKFITAGGDSNEVAGARRTIIYAIVGLIIIASARLLIGLIMANI